MALFINPTARIINESTPVVARPISVAWMLGASDGEANGPFCPEQFFAKLEHKIEYARGFEHVRGASEATRQFTASVNWSAS